MIKPSCSTCRFSSMAHSLAEKGECRRFAPKSTIGQLDPDVRYGYPETAGWPVVQNNDFCGEYQTDAEAPMKALDAIVREQIYGDGTAACHQRVIDLCLSAERQFGIKRA